MSFVNYSAIYPHPGLHGKFPELVYQGPWRGRIWEHARAKCEHIFIYFGWCVFMRTLMILAPWSMSYYLVLELLLLLEWEELCRCYPYIHIVSQYMEIIICTQLQHSQLGRNSLLCWLEGEKLLPWMLLPWKGKRWRTAPGHTPARHYSSWATEWK